MENTQNNNVMAKQEFRVTVQTVSWYSFKVSDNDLQTAYTQGSTNWGDYEPDQETVILLNVVPEISSKKSKMENSFWKKRTLS
mgnify:CR=1 FL=1